MRHDRSGFFQANVHIEKLNLAGNWMEGIGGVHIAHMLLENEYISELVGCRIVIIDITATSKFGGQWISRRRNPFTGRDSNESEDIHIGAYLVSKLAEDGELDAEVTHRVQSGWKNWKSVSGVLCDRKMNVKIKGKGYRTVVRPSLMYGEETWVLKKAQGIKVEVAEMRMLRWMCGVTKLDKIRNERIRVATKKWVKSQRKYRKGC